METARLPCRIMVYGDLPIGVRFALLLIALGDSRCDVVFVYPGSCSGSIYVASAQPMSSRALFAANTTHGRRIRAATDAAYCRALNRISVWRFGQQPQRGPQQWYGAPPQERTYANSSPIDPVQEQEIGRAHGSSLPTPRGSYNEREAPAQSLSIRRTIFSIWCKVTARRYVTASASAAPVSHGQACTRSRARKNGRIGCRRMK